jgi:hypothetical protein
VDDWLPKLLLLEDYAGDWEKYLEAIYEAFALDFMVGKIPYPEKRFSLKRHPMIQGKEATFWHIISEGKEESERTPDIRRCERIRWPLAMIENIGTDRVRVWHQQRQNKRDSQERRIAVSLPDFSYLMILADRGDFVLLWTAFLIEQKSQQEKLRREYELWTAENQEGKG